MTASPPSPAAPPDDVPPDSPPSPAALAWAAGLLGSSVRTVRALHGGSHASTHLLGTGVRDCGAILRRFRPGDPAPPARRGSSPRSTGWTASPRACSASIPTVD